MSDAQDNELLAPDPAESETEITDPQAGFAQGEDDDLNGIDPALPHSIPLTPQIEEALRRSRTNLITDPTERLNANDAVGMLYQARGQQQLYQREIGNIKRRLTQLGADVPAPSSRPERLPGTVGEANPSVKGFIDRTGRRIDKKAQRQQTGRIEALQKQLNAAQEQARLWDRTAREVGNTLNTPTQRPQSQPTESYRVSPSEEEALGAPKMRSAADILPAGPRNLSGVNAPAGTVLARDKTVAPDKFTGVTHKYTHPETMMTEWTEALGKALGPNRKFHLSRRTPFHHDLTIDGEHHVVTLDPVFNMPTIQGKAVVPEKGQNWYAAMAQALADAPNLPKALEAGVNLPQVSEQNLRHYGGALSRAYVARMKALRQISRKPLQMFYGQGDVEPIYYFEEDENLVSLPANLRGTDSGDLDDHWGKRGMMAMNAPDVFPDVLGYIPLPNGKFVVPNVAKGMARSKIEMNVTDVRSHATTDIQHHQDPTHVPNIVGKSKLRPESGEIDPEVIIDSLILPNMPIAQAQMVLNRDIAERVLLGQNKKGSETISYDDLADLELPGRDRLGQMHKSPWMQLYNRAGKNFGLQHPDAQYTAVDAVRVNLPRTSETGHTLLKLGHRLRTEDDRPIHLALNEHMFALLDPESATPEEYSLAVNEANRLLKPHNFFIGGGKKRGTTYDPQLEWDYRFWNHPRHSTKVQGSIGQKATLSVQNVMGYAADPKHQALMQQVGAILPGDEPVKMAQVYMAAMANMSPFSPTMRTELEKRNLKPDDRGNYKYGEDTWQNWITAAREILLDPMEGRNPQLADQLAQEGVLIPGMQPQVIADYHTAAPFMAGGSVPGYTVDPISYQVEDENGLVPDPTEGYLITAPPMYGLRAPLPYKFLTSIPVSDRPAKMNFSDLNRLYLRDKPLFEAIQQLGTPHQKIAQSIVEAALNVPISDEEITNKTGRILHSAPPIEEDARILEEKKTGVKPERAADLFYAQALKEWATDPKTGTVQKLALQKGQLRQRLLDPDALLHVGNFGIEGHNDARIFSDQVQAIRNLENQDRSTFLYYQKRFENDVREMAVQPSIRKSLWGGQLEHAYTHNMVGSMALPPNVLASGYTEREQRRYIDENDETFDQLSAVASRQPSVTINQTLPMQAISLQEANRKYALGMALDPEFTPRNLAINPAGSSAALRQADYDGDIELVALISAKMGVTPASEEAILRASLISSNLPRNKVDEIMSSIPTDDEDDRRQALIRGWQQTYTQEFAGGDAEAKGKNWIDNYIAAPGQDLLAKSIKKNVDAVSVATNTQLMQPAINEAHAKSMVGSIDSGLEGMIAVTSALGLTDTDDWEYLHNGLGLNSKQPAIDLGGKKNLDQLIDSYNWMRGGHWRHLFNREWRDSMHVDRVVDFMNAARRQGVHMEALEPLLRDASGDINQRNERVYNLLQQHDQAGRDVRLQDLLNSLAGTSDTVYDADEAMSLFENTPLSIYGRAMEMARTSYLIDNEEPTKTEGYPKSHILGLLHQEGIDQVPTWYARLISNRNDPAQLRQQGAPVEVDDARRRVRNYIKEKVGENPLLNMSYDILLGRRMASSNQVFGDLQEEGPEAYPRLIRDAARYGNDLFSQVAKGRLAPIAYGSRPWDRTNDLEIQYDEHKEHLAAKAREVRQAYQQGGLAATKRVELQSNELFSPSGLRDESNLQQMVEGFVLTGAEQTEGFHPAAREAMGQGTLWHNLYAEMRVAQGVDPKNMEQSMLWAGAGAPYYGRIDEQDPATKTVKDIKFVSPREYAKATQKGGSYRHNEAQVASYTFGKTEMTGEDWRYATLTYYNREQANNAMEQLVQKRGFRPRRPREATEDYLQAAHEARAISPAMTQTVLGNIQSTEMPPIDREDPEVRQNLSRMVGAQIMASFVARKTGLPRTKSIGGRRGRPQGNPIRSALRKTKAIKEAMTAAGYNKLYQKPEGLPVDSEEEFMSFNSMRKEGEEAYNLQQADTRTRGALFDKLNNEPQDTIPADVGTRGPPADVPDANLDPAPPTSQLIADDAGDNLSALMDQIDPDNYNQQLTRFESLAGLAGVQVRSGEDVQGWASTTVDKNSPIIRLGKNIEEHPRGDAVRFHELGHSMIRAKFRSKADIPDSVPGILGIEDTPETRETLDRQIERARIYAYGDYRQDPDKEQTASEKAADLIGLSMMDPEAIGDPSIAPNLVSAANLFVAGVDPVLASAAGLNTGPGSTRQPIDPGAAAHAPGAPNIGISGGGMGGGSGAVPPNGASPQQAPGQPGQPQGVSSPLPAVSDWMNQVQTNGAMYTMRARMKDGVYQFSVDELKVPGDKNKNVPTVDQLIKQVEQSGKYYAELNPWIKRMEEAMKGGVHDLNELSTVFRRSQAALKDIHAATPKPWEYQLSLKRKGDPGIAAHNEFNEKARARLDSIKDAQQHVSFMQNRLRMTQIQEGVLDLESYGDYFKEKNDKGTKGRSGSRGSAGGGMGDEMSPWGAFTDQMGGFAGLGWLGWGMFGLSRVDNFAFSGIREDIEMYRGGQLGLDAMARAEYGTPAGVGQTLTQKLVGNDFIKNYVKMQTGEKFQGWSTAMDDTWNRLYSVDEQVGIHTKKEMGKGILGAAAGALITGNMLAKTGKTVRTAGTALGAMMGFQALDGAESPEEEREAITSTLIDLVVGGGFMVQKFGKNAAPAAEAATTAAGKYAPKGIMEAIGYYGLGKAGATTLGRGATWLGKSLLTKGIPGVAQVALGTQGALMGMGALASLVPEDQRNAAEYQEFLAGSPVSRALAPWLADETPAMGWLQRPIKSLTRWGNDKTLGKLMGKEDRAPSAAQERAEALKAMESGDLSTLPIKDHEDLMFYMGAAGAGQTPEEVARYAARFMAMTGNGLDDLKDPQNPATKLMHAMVTQAVREQVNVKNMQDLGFSYAGELGLLPNNPRGQLLAAQYLQSPTILQEQLNMGIGFVNAWDNDRMGLSVGGKNMMAHTFATQVAPNYSTGQISRAMRLVQPSNPYEYNLSLSKGILTPQNIQADYGIPAANIGMTMDLSTGLPANYAALNANEDYTRNLQRGYTRWQWGFEEQEQARKFGVSQQLMNLSWQGTQMSFRHQREDMGRSIGNIQASLGMQLAERALSRDMMMMQFQQQEEDINIQESRRPILHAWQDEDLDYVRDRSGLEYGWKQEDYRRNLRFATGREKIDIRRNMERDQVRYGMDEDRRDTEEGRIEQQRQWEDEDFERKKFHYEALKGKQIELFDLQTTHMVAQANMQIANIHANMAQLEEQAVLAQQVHDIRQEDLINDRIAWEAQHKKMKESTEAMWAAEDARLQLIREQEKYTAAMNLLFVKWKDEDMPQLVQLAKDLHDWIQSARNVLADMPAFPGGGGTATADTSGSTADNATADSGTPTVTPPALPVQERPEGLVPPMGGEPSGMSAFNSRTSPVDMIERLADVLFNSNAARNSLERQYGHDKSR